MRVWCLVLLNTVSIEMVCLHCVEFVPVFFEWPSQICVRDLPNPVVQNEREKTREAKLVVYMEEGLTVLVDPHNPRAEGRKFSFDKSYWSHDGFQSRPDGYFEPTTPKYADQVYTTIIDRLGTLSRQWCTDALVCCSINWCHPMDKIILCPKYFRYLPQTNTILFSITFAIKRANVHLSSSNTIKLASSALLFILQLSHTTSSICQLKNR